MLPMTTVFMVVAPILLITGITILSMGIMYRIREQIIVSIGLLLLGLGFVVAVLALNKIDENLMINYGWRYPYVKLLEGGILNPLKGPISPSFVQLGSWAASTNYMLAASVLLLLGVVLLSYVGSFMIGLEGAKALILPVVILVIGLAGVYYLNTSISLMAKAQDISAALHARDMSGYLRTAAMLLGFIIVTIGPLFVYFETRSKEYLLYSASYFLMALAWAVASTSFFTVFERRAVFDYISSGSIGTPLSMFTAGAVLIVFGSVGLLIASTVEVVGSALGAAGAEEEFEELEEEVTEEVAEEEE